MQGCWTPDIKHRLFGVQEGKCGGYHVRFEFRNLEVDHIIPRADGGRDHDSNLQLLCGSCNRVKGDRDMAHLRMRLKELGVGQARPTPQSTIEATLITSTRCRGCVVDRHRKGDVR